MLLKQRIVIFQNQSGGVSKDTWILSKKQKSFTSLNISKNQNYLPKRLENLPSRSGENLFWVGRYTSRMLSTSRLLRMIYGYKAELQNYQDSVDQEVFYLLLKSLTHLTMTYPGFVGNGAEEKLKRPEEELLALIKEVSLVGGLGHTIQSWKNAANVLRDRWSIDSWRCLTRWRTNGKK